MPPTVADIKARLDRAVDKEGNVLNMEAVHEIVTWLESVNITEEALQATRIGLIMNLMRKKTTNEDLAKRVKNLIKKWKGALLKQHPKKLMNGDANNTNDRKGNGIDSDRRTPEQTKKGVKRKLKNADNSPVPQSNIPSPKNHSTSPRIRPSQKQSKKPASPLINQQLLNQKLKDRGSPALKTTTQHSPLVNEDFKNLKTIRIENDIKTDAIINTREHKNSNVHTPKTDFNTEKASDTRVQEDRISSCDSGFHGSEGRNSLNSEPCSQQSSAFDLKKIESFEPISEEDLIVPRRELPADFDCPDVQADGVNGVFDDNDSFCKWTDEIVVQEKDYHILPYVILD